MAASSSTRLTVKVVGGKLGNSTRRLPGGVPSGQAAAARSDRDRAVADRVPTRARLTAVRPLNVPDLRVHHHAAVAADPEAGGSTRACSQPGSSESRFTIPASDGTNGIPTSVSPAFLLRGQRKGGRTPGDTARVRCSVAESFPPLAARTADCRHTRAAGGAGYSASGSQPKRLRYVSSSSSVIFWKNTGGTVNSVLARPYRDEVARWAGDGCQPIAKNAKGRSCGLPS